MSVTTTSGLSDLDRFEQRIEIAASGGDFHVRLGIEQAADTFANEVVVFRQNKANRHSDQHMTVPRPKL